MAYRNTKNNIKNMGIEVKESEIPLDVTCEEAQQSVASSGQSLYRQMQSVINKIDQREDDDNSTATNVSSMVTEDTGSYIQVTIKKHHSKKELVHEDSKSTPVKQHGFSQTSGRIKLEHTHVQTSPVKLNCKNKPGQCLVMESKSLNDFLHDDCEVGRVLNDANNHVLYKCSCHLTHHPILVPYPSCKYQQPSNGDGSTNIRNSSSFKRIFKDRVISSLNTYKPPEMENNLPDSDKVEDIKDVNSAVGKQWVREKFNKFRKMKKLRSDPEKIELYCFDHGHTEYYETTDFPPVTASDIYAEKVEIMATKFWTEVFGVPLLLLTFITSFLLQLERFVLYGIFRPLVVGFTQIFSDYLFKPLLAAIFNAIVQPPLVFAYNVLSSVRDLFRPAAQAAGYFIHELANLIKTFRLVEINQVQGRTKHV